MARITTALSAVDLDRLIDALEGTAHLDEDAIDQDHTEHLRSRLTCLYDQLMAQERQPTEAPDSDAVQEIAELLFS